jgi:hypothetical protein
MTRTEDRLADALDAVARTVREDTLRPLTAPGPSHRPRGRPGWLAPVAAAVGVALVVGLAVLAGRITSGHTVPTVPLPPGVPRYYVETSLTGGRPVVRSTATGAVTSTVPVPEVAAANASGYALATADATGTYFAAASSPADRGERLYRFRLTPTGRVTGFSAVPAGALASRQWAADALAVSPDGPRIAVGMSFAGPPGPCGARGERACPRARPDYVMAIDLATGARTVWRWGRTPVEHGFSVESLSWTNDDRKLILLGQWCATVASNQTCSRGRITQVRALYPAAGGGSVAGGRGLLYQPSSSSDIVQALISPDGTSVTAVVLRGRVVGNSQISGSVPQDLSVERISVAEGHAGQVLGVLYQRRLGDTSEVNGAPDFLALSQDGSGQYFMLNIGLCVGHCTDGANVWIHDGRLVPLAPADGREADQAW